MDLKDRHLILLLSQKLPVLSRPFQWVSRKLGMDEADVLLRLQRLKAEGYFEKICAIFDIRLLGYRRWDIAMQVGEENISPAVALLKEHPATTSIRLYDDPLNLWFQLAMPSHSNIEDQIVFFHREFSSKKTILLPLLKHVFSASLSSNAGAAESVVFPSEKIANCIRVLQKDFPLSDRPFKKMAEDVGTNETEFLFRVQSLVHAGCLKAVRMLPEKNIRNNALFLLSLPAEKEKAFGAWIAKHPRVFNCNKRLPAESLNFNFHLELATNDLNDCREFKKELENMFGEWRAHFLLLKEVVRKEPVLFSQVRSGLCNADLSEMSPKLTANEATVLPEKK